MTLRTMGGIVAVGLLTWAASGGPITPPAETVSSTYKTLTEVEPRVAVNGANTPGDADSVFKITQPGSYFLTGNVLGQSGKNGIEIAASGVTLDLNGFRLQGVGGSLSGVYNTVAAENIRVMNGSADSWGQNGINLDGTIAGNGSIVDHVRSSGNGNHGIMVPIGTLVKACMTHNNGGDGVYCGESAVITECTSRNNTRAGFSVGSSAVFSGCMAAYNDAEGFVSASSSTLVACMSISNAGDGFAAGEANVVNSCESRGNGGDGFLLGPGSVISACMSYGNAEDGIQVSNDSLVRDNVCDSNGLGADGAGVHATNGDIVITDNVCTDSDRGIDVDTGGCFIARNYCSGNTTNWDVAANNVCLVIEAALAGAVLGDVGGVSPGSSNPNANYTF